MMEEYGLLSMSSVVWTVICGLILYKLIDWYNRYSAWVTICDRLPGKREKHWLWGHLNDFPSLDDKGLEYNIQECKKYPRMRRTWASKVRFVVIISHPETAKQLLTKTANQAPKARGPGTPYEVGTMWLGEGLLLANGDRWARNRKLLTPAFHYDALQPYLIITNRCTDIFLEKIDNFAAKNKSFEVFQHVGLCSLDIITQCAFSYNASCQTQGDRHPYVQAVIRLQDLWAARCFNPFLYLDFIYYNFTSSGKEFLKHCNYVHGIAEEIIAKRRQTLEEEDTGDNARKLDFLGIILTAKDEEGGGLTDLEIRNEVDTFLFEGHDTTTSSTSFILTSLAQHPSIQAKCQAEIDSILDGRESDHIEWKDLNKLEYLSQCIKEGLRLHTPIFFLQRMISEDMEIDGYHIPAWTNVAIAVYELHHNETVWGEDHMEFKPERFSPENTAKMHPFQFIPFSAGQRNCIGQNFAMNEIKVIVARTLHRYSLSVVPDQKIEKLMGIVMRTKNGVFLNATPR